MTSIRTGIPVNSRYVTLEVSVWCQPFRAHQLCFVISPQTAPLSLKAQQTFYIPHHTALAINICPLKEGHRWKLFHSYWQPCWILLPDAILERKKGEKTMPWFADTLTQEATRGFFVHLSKRAHSPSSDCVGSFKKLHYSDIPGPWCSWDKSVLTLWRPRLWCWYINLDFSFRPQEIC